MAWTINKGAAKVSRAGEMFVYASEEAADSNDKRLLVSDIDEGHSLEILSIRVEYTATATVGTRNIFLRLIDTSDSDDVVFELDLQQAITASQAPTFQLVARSGFDANLDELPKIAIGGPVALQVFDNDDIDALDDLVLHVTGLLKG